MPGPENLDHFSTTLKRSHRVRTPQPPDSQGPAVTRHNLRGQIFRNTNQQNLQDTDGSHLPRPVAFLIRLPDTFAMAETVFLKNQRQPNLPKTTWHSRPGKSISQAVAQLSSMNQLGHHFWNSSECQ